VLDLSNFPGGPIEAQKAPMGVKCGERCPLHTGEGAGRGAVPLPENFLVFDLKMANFGVF